MRHKHSNSNLDGCACAVVIHDHINAIIMTTEEECVDELKPRQAAVNIRLGDFVILVNRRREAGINFDGGREFHTVPWTRTRGRRSCGRGEADGDQEGTWAREGRWSTSHHPPGCQVDDNCTIEEGDSGG